MNHLQTLFGFDEREARMIEAMATRSKVNLRAVIVTASEDGEEISSLFETSFWYERIVRESWHNFYRQADSFLYENDTYEVIPQETKCGQFMMDALINFDDIYLEMVEGLPMIGGSLSDFDLTDFSEENLIEILTSMGAIREIA